VDRSTLDPDLRRAADVALVVDTVARIAQASDHGTLEEYAELLDRDMVWEMPANPATGIAAQVRRGRDDMVAGSADRRAAGGQGPGSATRHVVSNTSVDPRGDTASAVSYWRFYVDTTSAPRVASMGVWRDEFVRGADGHWRLARRRVEVG
jgi:3-phenylpropionate/cinnamic acid dioxygenase small subunit